VSATFKIVFDVLATLFRFIGLLAFGLGVGWFVLDTFPKAGWQLQIALFLGFLGTVVGLAHFTSAGGLGAFALGAGAAMFVWGLFPKTDIGQKGKE
jgi:hypothetical protein